MWCVSTQPPFGKVEGKLAAAKRQWEDQQAHADKAINDQIDVAQTELNALNGKLVVKRQALVETEASMQALVKRLHLGA
jgi:hypothetical protein